DVTPSITGGILSRNRTWRDTELAFRQTDTLTSGGQAGGARGDAGGELVGISALVPDGFVLSWDAPVLLRAARAVTHSADAGGSGEAAATATMCGAWETEALRR